MLRLSLFQEPWLKLAESIGGPGFAVVCLTLALVCTLVWHAALVYFKFGTLEKGLVEVRQQMITRDSFALALSEMERRLNNWANERFQPVQHWDGSSGRRSSDDNS